MRERGRDRKRKRGESEEREEREMDAFGSVRDKLFYAFKVLQPFPKRERMKMKCRE